ncbi:DUF934 domain-containing protein [Insolitispirillum peregrinum]|uniref:DUF934 domain-containing protein n=1 Tax=Insolitispirillum peregrinum TaxID=80876 RepID=UPI00360CECB2
MPLVKKTAEGVELIPTGWTRLAEGDALPETGAVLVSLSLWLEQRDTLRQRAEPVGVWLASNTDTAFAAWGEALAGDLLGLPVVAIDFPVFGDGRGYSIAALLRQRHGYRGELRAIGNVLVDQVSAMARVGFDGFEVAEGTRLELLEQAWSRFPAVYQTATDGRETIWQRRAAFAAAKGTGA